MIIAISSTGKEINSLLDPRFGRCAFYAFYDSEEKTWSFAMNPAAREGGGAGIKAAQFLADQNVGVLLTGNVGPNAFRVLSSAGIKICLLPQVSLEGALSQYQEGQYRAVDEPSVGAHAGINAPRRAQQVEVPPKREKVAVATEGEEVAQHFGRCPAYTLVEIEGSTVKKEVIPTPGHQPDFLPRFLAERGVKCVIAGGMGPRAQNLFARQGIKTITGITGTVAAALNSYFSDSLVEGESLCTHDSSGDGHGCEGH